MAPYRSAGPVPRVSAASDNASSDDTGALCAEIYTPELFTKVRRPIHPLDAMA